jgi:hypothetical protein
MSTDRDTTRIVRSWLRADEHESADRVLDAVLDRLDTTPQRRITWWPARRLPDMNTMMKLGLAAAAVVIAALLGYTYLVAPNVGGPGLDDPSPTPTPEPRALVEGAEGPGSFTTEFYAETPVTDPVQVTFEMPADWGAVRPWVIAPTSEGSGAAIALIQISGLYSDPCLDNADAPDVPVGSTAAELASALTEHAAYEATATGDIMVDGYEGIRMELVMPSDLDYTTCQGGQFWVWDAPFFAERPNRWDLWILDLDGSTAVLLAEVTDASAQELDQIEGIANSMQIEP